LAWCIGPDGLRSVLGKSHFQALLGFGIMRNRIVCNLNEGMKWFLVVFPDTGCRLADWAGLFAMVRLHYGEEVASRLERHGEPMRTMGAKLLSQKEAEHLDDPAIREHPEHPEHMSPERYLSPEHHPFLGSKETDKAAWVFLRHSVGMNRQYTGTGRCRNDNGAVGDEEYLAPNRRIDCIPGHVVIDLQVTLEPQPAGTAGPV
jgi:hypothetical protein